MNRTELEIVNKAHPNSASTAAALPEKGGNDSEQQRIRGSAEARTQKRQGPHRVQSGYFAPPWCLADWLDLPRCQYLRVRVLKRLMVLVGLTTAYFVAATLGLRLAYLNPSATAVWPGTGIALAAFLVAGYSVWPAILIGAFLVNVTTAGTFGTSVEIALGNTLEGLLGAYLVNRFANGRSAIDRVQDIFK